jgi:hypothetical protein
MNVKKHPVHPQILDILIWLTPRFAIRQNAISENIDKYEKTSWTF